ncbi:keto-deoxy-phosphogluconate aldolase, partial [Pimelobacter simplex]|nr:keto-deoxy-phosphogluconate aldolase [Pimelobacter simplex]
MPRRSPLSPLDLVPVLPVVVVDDLASAVPLARALVDGGLPAIELTLRTPVALEAIRAIAAEVPEIALGAGTIVTPDQASAAVAAGAGFLVSPGCTPSLLDALQDTGVPFLPGTSTVSEVMAVLDAGLTDMKFFPAEA